MDFCWGYNRIKLQQELKKHTKTETMATQKLTKQDVSAGRVHRCENCETKCDDKFFGDYCDISYGQRTGDKKLYFCCEDCSHYYTREKAKPQVMRMIETSSMLLPSITKALREAMRYISFTDKPEKMKVVGLFEMVKHLKSLKRAGEMLLSMENTSAELAVAFSKARDDCFEVSEIVQSLTDELLQTYIWLPSDYGELICIAKWCDEMTKQEALNAWL
jgi:hypothetical protein